MSRAVRRQQPAQTESQGGLKGAFGSRQPKQTRGAKPQQQKRRLLRMPGWMDDIWSELKKVTWPTREETAYLTMVVIIVAVSVGLMLGAVDVAFSWIIDQLLLK
jgi:preprotein translocase subunit SecE